MLLNIDYVWNNRHKCSMLLNIDYVWNDRHKCSNKNLTNAAYMHHSKTFGLKITLFSVGGFFMVKSDTTYSIYIDSKMTFSTLSQDDSMFIIYI